MTPDPGTSRGLTSWLLRGGGFLVVIGFVAVLVYGVAAQSPDTTIDDALATGEPAMAPGFELDVLQPGKIPDALDAVVSRATADRRVALNELRGTPVVLNFWASWCDPCRVEAPVLERGWKAAGREGVLFLGLDQQDVREDAREFLTALSVSYPNIHEAGKETSRRYGATGLPETFFLSAEGRVVGHVIGAIDDEQLRTGVQAAKTGEPVGLGPGGDRRSAR